MFRLIICFIYMAGFLLCSLPTLNRMKKLNRRIEVSKRDEILHQVPKHWSKVFLKLAGAKVTIEGVDHIPDGPVVIVSNHEGDFDIPVLLGCIDKPFGFISKIEVKRVPILSQWMEVIHCVFLDRKDRRKALQSIRDGVKLLKKGHSLAIFPEGTRSKGGPIGRFKSGSFRLAVDAKVPIIPVSIKGTSDIFEKNNRLIRPANVKVIIGSPVTSHLHSEKDLNELANEVRDIIINQLENKKIAS